MQFKRRLRPTMSFDITPMVDIVFLLVIFFMVSSTFIKTRGIKVNLPKSISSQAESQNQLVVTIKANGQLYLNGSQVPENDLGRRLKDEKNKSGQDVVVIKGDETVAYSQMVRIMDIARIAGLSRISLATSQN